MIIHYKDTRISYKDTRRVDFKVVGANFKIHKLIDFILARHRSIYSTEPNILAF